MIFYTIWLKIKLLEIYLLILGARGLLALRALFVKRFTTYTNNYNLIGTHKKNELICVFKLPITVIPLCLALLLIILELDKFRFLYL